MSKTIGFDNRREVVIEADQDGSGTRELARTLVRLES